MSACCCCRSPPSGRSRRCRTATPSRTMLRVFGESSLYIKNTLIYASLAGLIDVVVGHRDRLSGAAHATARPQRARLGRFRRAGHSRRRARHRLSARLLRRATVGRHAAGVVVDHDRAGARHPPPALRAARLPRGAAADLRVAGGSGRKPRRHQGAHGAPHRGAADDRRHPGRLRHQLRHRRGRAVGDVDAGADRIPTRRCPTVSTS